MFSRMVTLHWYIVTNSKNQTSNISTIAYTISVDTEYRIQTTWNHKDYICISLWQHCTWKRINMSFNDTRWTLVTHVSIWVRMRMRHQNTRLAYRGDRDQVGINLARWKVWQDLHNQPTMANAWINKISQ